MCAYHGVVSRIKENDDECGDGEYVATMGKRADRAWDGSAIEAGSDGCAILCDC